MMLQLPDSISSPSQDILELQQSNMQAIRHHNGSHSSDFPSSPRNNFNNLGNNTGIRLTRTTYTVESFTVGDSNNYSSSSTNSQSQYDSTSHPPIRETGIIEKLLHSYGFIQCCERQARLFFHFSQFTGKIDHLKIGDPVEFEMTYDRRTGKPIASTVTKIAPDVVLSEERVTGLVTTEVKGQGSGDNTGRISYENRGECFFLPYTKDDVEGNVTLRSGDAVSFQVATNQRGTLGACHVRFENPSHPVKYHGVICSKKDNYGFIERADVVKEIFFHYTEARDEFNLGDDVEFLIQTRNGKEVACNITKLPSGSVVFEDVSPEVMRGQVLKPLERGGSSRVSPSDPLSGRIRYRAADHSEVEVLFGDKDQLGEFTLRHGDWVQFYLATDRRDHLKRATNITLLDESFSMSGERREQGVVCVLKEGFGFIQSVEREQVMYFDFAEVLRLGQEISVGDEVEFTVDPISMFAAMNNRYSVIRVKHLPPGTVQFETLVERDVRGVVTKEASYYPLPEARAQECGIISCQVNNIQKSISYTAQKCVSRMLPRVGDKVIFDVYQVKSSKELIAMVVQTQHSLNGTANGGSNLRPLMQGFIAALKDCFGFIETADHNKEVFFHFSNLEGNPDTLELGAEVEYSLGRVNESGAGCDSAEFVRVLPRGSVYIPKPLEPTLNGTVVRTLRALNPDQAMYSGLVQTERGASYEFGIMGLSCKREILQVGDPVTFQADIEGRATNIVPVRQKRRATVDAIKDGYGFLSVEEEDSRRLFFHMSEVRGNSTDLQPGDAVEFVMLTNPRNGKSSACNVVKVRYTLMPSTSSQQGTSSGHHLHRSSDSRSSLPSTSRPDRYTSLPSTSSQPGTSSGHHLHRSSDSRSSLPSTSRPDRSTENMPRPRDERPSRLLSRLRTISQDEPRASFLRHPHGPDGSRGFRPRRPLAEQRYE